MLFCHKVAVDIEAMWLGRYGNRMCANVTCLYISPHASETTLSGPRPRQFKLPTKVLETTYPGILSIELFISILVRLALTIKVSTPA